MRQLTVIIDEMTFLDLIAGIRILSREAKTRLWADEAAAKAEIAYRTAEVMGQPILPSPPSKSGHRRLLSGSWVPSDENKQPGFGPGHT